MSRRHVGGVVGVCAALALLGLGGGTSGPRAAAAGPTGAVPNPKVSGPIKGGLRGYPWNKSLFSLRGRGFDYTENEYFFSGRRPTSRTPARAPYESRMLVRLPRNARNFSGTVLVEWLNVTAQSDFETAWPVEAQYLMRHGIGYIGVSAQLAGVCCGPTTLKGWDPRPVRTACASERPVQPRHLLAGDQGAAGARAQRREPDGRPARPQDQSRPARRSRRCT